MPQEGLSQQELAMNICTWAAVLERMTEQGKPDIYLMSYGSQEQVATPEDAALTRLALDGFAMRCGFRGGVEEARDLVGDSLSQQIR